jgi:hypothetical protein
MDPITLIVTALATGTASGASEAAASALKDAYEALKARVSARFAGRNAAEVVLTEHETDPDTWRAPLAKELRDAGAGTDPAVIEAAQHLMALIDEQGTRTGKYTIDLRGAQGVQVGDHNQQVNRFSTRAKAP